MRHAIAVNRFGLGARPDDRIDDPRRWLLDQLAAFETRPAPIAALPDATTNMARYFDFVAARRQARAMQEAGTAPGVEPEVDAETVHDFVRDHARHIYADQAVARITQSLTASAPFVERLAHFWANHFAVSIDRFSTLGIAGNLEFEAIRPHVLGRFPDMLLAVERHPAMLMYLDQFRSIGPESVAARRLAERRPEARQRGLNENLAREVLELHTLGVDGGYSQADVQELARALTGWTIVGQQPVGDAPRGSVLFRPLLHEPGERQLLGRRYAATGEAQSRAMLIDLALHPATARHLATKLARHFVADDPPKALIDRLAAAYSASDGDLPTLYRTLIEAPEAWATPLAKFKSPWDWSLSALRGLGMRSVDRRAVRMVGEVGQPVWRPGSPAGWGDTAATWAGSDALMRRVEAAQQLAALVPAADARTLAPQLFGGTVSPSTAAVIAGAESPAQATALLLAAPEFQRR